MPTQTAHIQAITPHGQSARQLTGALALALCLVLATGPVAAQEDAAATDAGPVPVLGEQITADSPPLPAEPSPDAVPLQAEPSTADTPPVQAELPDESMQAERDYQMLYGGGQYDPAADSELPEPARIGSAYDPWEGLNRKTHRFNSAVDRTIALPLARAYMRVVPRPVRLGVSNFFSNLGQPVSAVNALLQGKPRQAIESLGRFTLNTTLGIGGIFDPASDAKMANRSEDFGQTLGVWGWKRSRFVELPLFGPRTVRDTFGLFGDAPLSPLRQVGEDPVRIGLQGLQLVDVRTQLMATDSLRVGVEDDYSLVRDAWTQRRNYQIFGDTIGEGDEALPEYLFEDSDPIVPVGAMPVLPSGGN